MAWRKPSRAASRRRRSRPWTGRSAPSSDTSPQATVPGASGTSRAVDASASATASRARVRRWWRPRPGSRTGPARDVQATTSSQHGHQQRQPVRRAPPRAPAEASRCRRCHERLDLDQDRPGAFHGGRDHDTRRLRAHPRPGTRGQGRARPEGPRRSSPGRRSPPWSRSGSWRRAQPERAVSVAFQDQHHVHEVLQGARTGEAAVLGHVTDQDHRCARARGTRQQAGRRIRVPGRPILPALPGRPRSASAPSPPPAAGTDRLGGGQDGVEVRLRQHLDAGPGHAVGEAQAVGSQMQLVRRLLARGIQHVGTVTRAALPGPDSARRRPRSPAPGSTCRYPVRRRAAPVRLARGRRRGPGRPRRCRRSGVARDGRRPHAAAGARACPTADDP